MWIATARSTPSAPCGPSLEQPLLEHEPRAVVALLARLEHQQDPARERVPPLREQARRAQEHRDVGVVAAGVHHARQLGREREPRVLGEGQGVHVGAEEDRGTRPRALDHRDHRRVVTPGRPSMPERPRATRGSRLRLRQLEAPFRAPVQPPADVDDVGEDRPGRRHERWRRRRGGRRGHASPSSPAAISSIVIRRPSRAERPAASTIRWTRQASRNEGTAAVPWAIAVMNPRAMLSRSRNVSL